MRKLLVVFLVLLAVSLFGQTVVTIEDIQGHAASSPYNGQSVTTYGVVTGVFSRGFFIEMKPGGAWKGIYVYQGYSWTPDVGVGDSVEVTGTVSEYYDFTEINSSSYTVLAQTTPPDPVTVTTGAAGDEQYEGVLLNLLHVACTNADLGFGEWEVNDGSGPFRVDDWGVSWSPAVGDTYNLTGILNYAFDNYKLEPRDSIDIELLYSAAIDTVTIYDIQHSPGDSSTYLGLKVATFGVVTGVFSQGFFIGEKPNGAWKGVYVYQGSSWTPDVSVGDSVYVEGTITEFNGMTEFSDASTYSVLGNTTPPDPVVVNTTEANDEMYESVLIKVQDVVCVDDSLGGGKWAVMNPGYDTLVVDDWNVPYRPVVDYTYNITGNMVYSFGERRLEPRDSSDIVNTGVEEKPEIFDLNVPSVTSGFTLSFTLRKTTSIEIGVYDVNGRLVKRLFKGTVRAGEPKEIRLPDLSTGIFFLMVKTDNGKNISRFIYF